MPDGSLLHSLAVTLADADSVPDAELLRRYADSTDAVAFELLVRRHAELVWSVCRSVHPADHQTAEDAFQATFLALARKAGSIRDGSAAGWLFRVARNAASRAKRGRHSPLPEDVSAAVPPDRAESAEVARIVSEEVDRLAAKFREPVLLCFFEGHSHAQAAERLGWAVGTVASRLARAKDRLRDRLTRRGVALPAVGFGLVTGAAPVRAAVSGATGTTTDAVRSLTTEVLHSMTIRKLTLTAACVAAVLAVAGAGTALAWPYRGDDKKADVEVKGAKAKPADDDLTKLQGKWKVTRIVSNEIGEAPAEALDGMEWEFVGTKIRGKNPGQEVQEMGSFTLDSSKPLKHIDMTGFDAGKGKDRTMPGIYELKSDTLTVCVGDDGTRPTEFKAEKGGKTGLIVLQRVEPKADEKKAAQEKVRKQLEAFQTEFDALQGEWKITTAEFADDVGKGKRTEALNLTGFVIAGNEVKCQGEQAAFLMAFDATASPKQLNLTTTVGPKMAKGKLLPGIYELKDGKLMIAFGEPALTDKGRPTEFKADKEKRVTMWVLEKKK